MLVKIYGITWAFIAAVAALIFLTGSFTPAIGVVFGFVLFGMVFMGMMNVLPSTVGHNAPVRPEEPKKVPAKKEPVEMFPANAVHIR